MFPPRAPSLARARESDSVGLPPGRGLRPRHRGTSSIPSRPRPTCPAAKSVPRSRRACAYPLAVLKAVLFDVDFTLFRPGPELGPEGYRRVGERHGLTLDPDATRRRAWPRSRSSARARSRPRRGGLDRIHRADRARHGRRTRPGRARARSTWCASGSGTRTSRCTRTRCRCSASFAAHGLRIGLVTNGQRDLDEFVRITGWRSTRWSGRGRTGGSSRIRRSSSPRCGHSTSRPRRPRWSATPTRTTSRARGPSGCARSSSTGTGSIRTSPTGSTRCSALPAARIGLDQLLVPAPGARRSVCAPSGTVLDRPVRRRSHCRLGCASRLARRRRPPRRRARASRRACVARRHGELVCERLLIRVVLPFGEVGPLEELAQSQEEPRLERSHREVPAVSRRVDPVAGEAARQQPRGRVAAEPVRDEVVRAVRHRDDDVAALPGALPLEQRGKHARHRAERTPRRGRRPGPGEARRGVLEDAGPAEVVEVVAHALRVCLPSPKPVMEQ